MSFLIFIVRLTFSFRLLDSAFTKFQKEPSSILGMSYFRQGGIQAPVISDLNIIFFCVRYSMDFQSMCTVHVYRQALQPALNIMQCCTGSIAVLLDFF